MLNQMRHRKLVGTFVLYSLAAWHAYALLTRPLHGYGPRWPLAEAVQNYSRSLLLYPKWSFFYYIPENNIKIQYVTDKTPGAITEFYGPGETYLDRIRAYRCASCGNASYQFFLLDEAPKNGWLLGTFLCRLEPQATEIRARLGVAHFLSTEFKPTKEVLLKCADFHK